MDPRAAQLNRLACAVLIGLLLALAWSGHTGALLVRSGDFPGFYAPAVIAHRGLWERLYDPELQRAVENEAWPEFNGSFYMSVYPPFVARVLQPLGGLPAQTGRLIFLFISLACFAASVSLIPGVSRLRTFVLLLCFAPLFYGVIGGQNSSMSLLCLAVCMSCLRCRDRARWMDYAAGAALGCWLFKPQFGAPMIGLVALLGLWRTLAGALAVGAVWYLVAASKMGLAWPAAWGQAVLAFSGQNYISNRSGQVSLAGFAQAMDHFSAAAPAALLAGFFLFLYPLAPRFSHLSLDRRLALSALALPLASPQTLFYDLSISAFALVWFWGRIEGNRYLPLLAYGMIVLLLCLNRHSLSAAPLVAVSLSLYQLGLWRARMKHAP